MPLIADPQKDERVPLPPQQTVVADAPERVSSVALDRPAAPSRVRTAPRRVVIAVVERAVGECFAPNARIALLTLLAVLALLGVIAYTLSVANAVVVVAAGAVMRIACERSNRR